GGADLTAIASRFTPGSEGGSLARLHVRSTPSRWSSYRFFRRVTVNAPPRITAQSPFFDFLPAAGWRPDGFGFGAGLPTAAVAAGAGFCATRSASERSRTAMRSVTFVAAGASPA